MVEFRKLIYPLIVFMIVGLVIPLVALVFKGNAEEDDFLISIGAYATYGSFILGVVNIVVVGFLSYMVYNATRLYNEYQMTPMLDFSKKERGAWSIINCSDAPARNIYLRFNFNYEALVGKEKMFFQSKWVSCYSLTGRSELQLNWLLFADKIELIFSNSYNREFYKCTYENHQVGETQVITKGDFDRFISNPAFSDKLTERFNFQLRRNSQFPRSVYFYVPVFSQILEETNV